MKRNLSALTVLLLAGTLFFSSCDDFFSSSWGKNRDYDPDKIDIHAGNIKNWNDAAAGNPQLAAAVTERLKKDLANVAQGSPTYNQLLLQEAGVNLAVKASGIGTAIITKAADLIDKLDSGNGDDEAVKDILSKVQGDFTAGNGKSAADNLTAIISNNLGQSSYTDSQKPEFGQAYKDFAQGSDVAEAVLVLALAVFQEKNINVNTLDSLDEWETKNLGLMVEDNGEVKVETDNGSATPNAIALAAYLNLINEKDYDNPITKSIKSGFLGQ